MPPDLSIVIVNYNTREPLRRTLDSIRRCTDGLQVETIIVDNDSHDGSAAMIRADYPDMTLIAPGHNTWFTGGNILGARAAGGEYLMLLNPDTVVQPGMLPTLIAALQAHPDAAIVTPQMRGLDGDLQRTCSRIPDYVDLLLGYTGLGVLLAGVRASRRARMWYADWDRTRDRAVEVVPGSCLLGRREELLRLGVFDARLKLYFPEDDLAQRLRAAGRGSRFVADAVVLHEEHASTRQAQRLASRIYFDDLITYARLHYGAARALLLWLLVLPTRAAMDIAQRWRGERARF